MKTFRVDARLRNNLLIKAREALGYKSPAEAARALGLSYPALVAYEALSKFPWHEKSGEWKQSALAISNAYKVTPEMLWPDEIGGVKRTRTSIEVDLPTVFLEAPKTPEDRLLKTDRMETIRNALNLLQPRERQLVISRFGLDGDEPITIEEIGRTVLGVHRSRAAQIEVRALNKLRSLIDESGDSRVDLNKMSEDDVRKAEIQARKTPR